MQSPRSRQSPTNRGIGAAFIVPSNRQRGGTLTTYGGAGGRGGKPSADAARKAARRAMLRLVHEMDGRDGWKRMTV